MPNLFAGLFRTLVEARDTTARLRLLLLARVERMALGADIYLDDVAFMRRTRDELSAAGTLDGDLMIIGMYAFLDRKSVV